MSNSVRTEIANSYLHFARNEARDRSAIYEAFAEHVAHCDHLLDFLATLPPDRRQPNLFFAAIRVAFGLPRAPAEIDEIIATHGVEISSVMKTHTTQKNEPGRCAVLLPVLAALAQPLALFEVGASAGLCLFPEKYGYDFGRGKILAASCDIAPVFPCEANKFTPLPVSLPDIVWRGGLDLNPLDIQQANDTAWLETLVWPEHTERLDRLRAAIKLVRQDPPSLTRGNLVNDLEHAINSMPLGATRVLFHTAVLSYVNQKDDRDAFARKVRAWDVVWISNESPTVFPDIAAKLKEPIRRDRFLLAVNGEPVAWTGPHGQSIDWLA